MTLVSVHIRVGIYANDRSALLLPQGESTRLTLQSVSVKNIQLNPFLKLFDALRSQTLIAVMRGGLKEILA